MICTNCKQPGEFYKTNLKICKECLKKRANEWAKAHPESRNKTRDKIRDKQNVYYKEWYKKNDRKRTHLKSAAYALVKYAVKTGKLIKPEACGDCGRKVKIEGHHNDYLKPLEVIWLCNRCHRKLHPGLNISK